MPRQSQQGRYPVVTFVVAALGVFAAGIQFGKRYIPANPENGIARESGLFLRQAGRQRIDWRAWSSETFAYARKEKKPMFVVLGATWSTLAKRIDDEVFVDTDVQSFLAKFMVCVRVDLVERPELISAFIPLTRARTGHDPGIQIVVLTPEGKLVSDIQIEPGNEGSTANDFFRRLHQAKGEVEAYMKSPTGTDRQLEEAMRLLDPNGATLPNFDDFDKELASRADLKTGSFPERGVSYLHPNVFRYLLARGRRADFDLLVSRFIASPMVDWLDGGFFRAKMLRAPYWLHYDKIATQNAEMGLAFATAHAAEPNPLYQTLAERTFDSLFTEFRVKSVLPATSRLGDGNRRGRSPRSSIPFAQIAALSPADRSNAQEWFNLRLETNASMTITTLDPQTIISDSASKDKLIETLRSERPDRRKFDGDDMLSSSGLTVARMIQIAALLGDERRLESCRELWSALKVYAASEDVVRSLRPTKPKLASLGDYLAFSDAALQWYVATGDASAFELGFSTLNRAIFLFRSDIPGAWPISYRSEWDPAPLNIRLPEVVDFVHESTTAQMIRLAGSYARFSRGSGSAQRQSASMATAEVAVTTALRNSTVVKGLGPRTSGFVLACLSIANDTHAVVVGHDAIEIATRLRRQFPGRSIGPAVGMVRKDLQNRGTGVYVMRAGVTFGPLDEATGRATIARELNAPSELPSE